MSSPWGLACRQPGRRDYRKAGRNGGRSNLPSTMNPLQATKGSTVALSLRTLSLACVPARSTSTPSIRPRNAGGEAQKPHVAAEPSPKKGLSGSRLLLSRALLPHYFFKFVRASIRFP